MVRVEPDEFGFHLFFFKQIHSFKLGIESEMVYDRKNLRVLGERGKW